MGRKDLPLVGVFSTCSPARPNPILVIAVRILECKGPTPRVAALDAKLSPWMNQLMDEMGQE